MMYEEFANKVYEINKDAELPNEQDYKTIEYVYTYHPAISNTKGKHQIALLYVEFGMSVIRDMMPRASEMKTTEEHYTTLNNEMEALKKKMENLRSGKIS